MTGYLWVCLSFDEFKFGASGKQVTDVAWALGVTGCLWVCLLFGEFKFGASDRQIPDVA
ncbi:hypothetical protein [Vibrio jasicida]|uniref:hypothetical protein n=1 Tax=Vibrio jasicida TaxID=766224 RepID=UPI0015E2A06C|nr:hypothetical protein [Vibrio jasicida]